MGIWWIGMLYHDNKVTYPITYLLLFPYRTLNNYLVWQMVNSLRSCLSKSFRDTYKGVKKALLGTEGRAKISF